MKKVLLISLFLIATGCANFTKPDKNLPPQAFLTNTEYLIPEVNISADLLEPCGDLQPLPQNALFTTVLENTAANTVLYSNCRAKHQSLVKVLQQTLNLKVDR